MSLFQYLFDTDYDQRRDIEELRNQQLRLSIAASGGVDRQQFNELAHEVKELAATVHVMMRILAEANLLDVAKIKAEVDDELRPKPRVRQPRPRQPVDRGPNIEVTCVKCQTVGMSHDSVKAGADWFCRPCARNP